jgi:hypothetical protein
MAKANSVNKLVLQIQVGAAAPQVMTADGLTEMEYHEMENAIINAISDAKRGSIMRALGRMADATGAMTSANAGYSWTKDGVMLFDSIGGNKYLQITQADIDTFVSVVKARLAKCKGASKLK